eukprot:scaffold178905_cov32-Tisochrysis_lutea.AAC.2
MNPDCRRALAYALESALGVRVPTLPPHARAHLSYKLDALPLVLLEFRLVQPVSSHVWVALDELEQR